MRLNPHQTMSADSGKKVNLWAVFLSPAIFIALMAFSVWSDIRDFNAKAPFLKARGEVAKLECDNHGHYQVKFNVGDQIFTRDSGNLYLHENCQDLAVGQMVSVWYSALDPSYVSFVLPDLALSHMKSEITTLVLFGYPFMAGFLFITMKLRKTA